MQRATRGCLMLSVTVALLLAAGCGNKFLDPTQVGRFRPVPAVNVILESLGVAEETPPVWEEAEEPKPVDTLTIETDYTFAGGDVVRISIFELLQEGVPFVNDYIVTETGKISIPEVGIVEAAGLTESQLEDEIKQILTPSLLKKPSVTVALLTSQQRTFSIYGEAVPQPGRYNIPRYDFRLADAIATAGGISQFNVSYIYVSRSITGREPIGAAPEPNAAQRQPPPETGGAVDPEKEMLEIIAPRAQKHLVRNDLLMASTEMAMDEELVEAAQPEGFEPGGRRTGGRNVTEPAYTRGQEPQQPVMPEAKAAVPAGRIEWIFQDGKWIPILVGGPEPEKEAVAGPPAGPELPEGIGPRIPEKVAFEEIGAGGVQARLIEVPADKLRSGDPRYNIIIRPGDSIHIPVDVIGEFCIMGNVNAQGFVPLTGRPVTLKMAVAAAGGLGPLAWPKSCEVVRRIGKNREEIVMVDLDKIYAGEQPDFFIKPLDTINVGTHPTARWRAVLRNAFRATYGFGFIYDRNFADRDFGTHRPFPDWF